MKFSEIVCPISDEKVDGNVNRLTTFLVVLLLALFVFTSIPYFLILVAMDYFVRACLKQKFSLLRWVASGLSKILNLQRKEINAAPKIFASRLGLLCALASINFFYLEMPKTSLIIALVLMGLSIMDSIFNFCLGCLIYHTTVHPFYSKKF